MLRIFIISAFFMFGMNAISRAGDRPELHQPLKQLFSHLRHGDAFKEMKISCRDCHMFSLKAKSQGPLAPDVDARLLSPNKMVCHQCHLGKVETPRPDQCSLCHKNTQLLRPSDHLIDWKRRHGKISQLDGDSCKKCHAQGTCSECHLKRKSSVNRVHRGNFRMTHSTEARFRPNSCTVCHQSQGFCMDCHIGKRK